MSLPDWAMSVPATVLLAAVATIGYLLGRRRDVPQLRCADNRQEILRALGVAQELESIAYRLKKSMAFHVPAILKFNAQLHRWEKSDGVSWHELYDQADDLLKPALRLSTEISHAYADLLQQMNHLSSFAELRTDPLTGVANRRALDATLEKWLLAHAAGDPPLSLALLDLDYFKRINDEQGHLHGDRVLQQTAQLLREATRPGDMLARFGGEEFVLLLPELDSGAASDLAERIRAHVEARLCTTISVGVASSLPDEKATSLLTRADAALYAAKNEGRNRVCVHEGESGRISAVPGRRGELPAAERELSADDDPAPIAVFHGEACS